MSSLQVPIAPADAADLVQIVGAAVADRSPVQIVGGGTKRCIGYPQRCATEVSMTRFDRIVDYDPAELVLTVGAGVRLTTIDELLATKDQMLAFEPFDFAASLGGTTGSSTIGGVVAAGFAGSRRVSAGNVRDHVLGFTAVSGRGELFVAGGRVVKNVTGYDVSKLMCGSWGQLAALTEITLKVLPRSRCSITLRARDLSDAHAFAAMTLAMRSQADVCGAAYVPIGTIDGRSHTVFRLEGFGPSVEARALLLARLLTDIVGDTAMERFDAARSRQWWAQLSCGSVLRSAHSDSALWRICIPSTAGVRLCDSLRALDGVFSVDWGGALFRTYLPTSASAEQVRTLAESCRGHATLLNAPLEYRHQVTALHPERVGVAALAQRVKTAFDPTGILDPQRFAHPER